MLKSTTGHSWSSPENVAVFIHESAGIACVVLQSLERCPTNMRAAGSVNCHCSNRVTGNGCLWCPNAQRVKSILLIIEDLNITILYIINIVPLCIKRTTRRNAEQLKFEQGLALNIQKRFAHFQF